MYYQKLMKSLCAVLLWPLFNLIPFGLKAQQQVTVISRCGGTNTVVIPNIIDNDLDGMDDRLEQKLLDHFMPVVIQFNNETCPGPALDGTGDSNLIVCHIFPYPQQYTTNTNLSSVVTHPVAVVPSHGLYAGLVWYNPLIIVNTAVLYGQDCGLSGHTADVEGFSFSLKYIGTDTAAGWMYDTVMANWMGGTIQTISHAGTLCEQIETHPYKSVLFPTGLDTVYASPDKHGNYLTISGCGASFICNPGCGGTQIKKNVRNINLGEPNATLIADLGSVYPAYAGNDPWSTSNFLAAQGGNAGAIRDKMIKALTSDFATGQTLTAQQICPLYTQCDGPSGHSDQQFICAGNTYNFYGQNLSSNGVYTHTLTNHYGCDSIITLTLAVGNPSTATLYDITCAGRPYNFNGRQLTATGVYIDTLTSMFGCDSSITLNLTVTPGSNYNASATACVGSTYNFGGQQLTSPGTYVNTFSNVDGCDSIVHLTLSFAGSPTSSSYTAATCSGNSYNFNGRTLTSGGVYTDTLTGSNGCDSVITLTLNVTAAPTYSFSASTCNSTGYTFKGQLLTTSGIYNDTITAFGGCDSIVSLLLTVDSPAVSWAGTSDTVLVNSSSVSLTGGNPAGGSYSGTGVNGNTFYPDSVGPGSYTITYSYSDSLNCSNSVAKTFVVIVSGITETGISEALIYPNPANDKLIIQFTLLSSEEATPMVYDLTGKLITVPFTRQTDRVVLNTASLADGMYWLKFNIAGNPVSKKFVKLAW
ncbi:MAG: hypothetical protein JWO06_2172 [Bacteroidota bacterium]|nr:hypothetical protein [Bacteroidota bacterium]